MWDEDNYETIQYDEAGNPTYGGYSEADIESIYGAGGGGDGGDGWTPEEIEYYFGDGALNQEFTSLFNDPAMQQIDPATGKPYIMSAGTGGTNWFDSLLGSASNISPSLMTGILGSGVTALGSYLGNQTATAASEKYAQAQLAASQLAAEAAKFKPVGVTTNFGTSQFGYDNAGNLINAGYRLTPEMKAQQDALMAASGGMLGQFTGSQAATAPMGAAGQAAMALGNQYLGTDPAAQAKKYYDEQMALLQPTRERDYANLESRLASQGRLGLATGGTSTLGASNPEMEALMNAQRMQDLNLAAQSTQGGMDYAKYGAGLVGTGGDLLKAMYGTQVGAYSPYQTAQGGAVNIEGLGQQAMDYGTAIGSKTSTYGANAGSLLGQGMINSAQTMQAANSYSPWGGLLTGLGNQMQNYQQPQQQMNPLAGTGYNY